MEPHLVRRKRDLNRCPLLALAASNLVGLVRPLTKNGNTRVGLGELALLTRLGEPFSLAPIFSVAASLRSARQQTGPGQTLDGTASLATPRATKRPPPPRERPE